MGKTARIALVLALVATLALFAFIPGPVQAQSGFDITYDFTTGLHGWAILNIPGTCANGGSPTAVQSGAGLTSQEWLAPSSDCTDQSRLQAVLSWPTTATVTSIVISGTIAGTKDAGPGSTQSLLRAWTSGPPFSGFVCGMDGANVSAGTALSSPLFNGAVSCTGAGSWLLDVTSDSTIGPAIVTSVEFIGSGSSPVTPTPTFTPTPTVTPTPTPLASGPCSTGWTKTYDFTQQAYGFVNTPSSNSTWELGTGFNSEDLKDDLSGVYLGTGDHLHAAIISRQIYSTTINSGSVTVDYHPGSAGPSIDARNINVQLGSTTLVDGGNPPPAGSAPLTFSGSFTNGTLTITAIDAGLLH